MNFDHYFTYGFRWVALIYFFNALAAKHLDCVDQKSFFKKVFTIYESNFSPRPSLAWSVLESA